MRKHQGDTHDLYSSFVIILLIIVHRCMIKLVTMFINNNIDSFTYNTFHKGMLIEMIYCFHLVKKKIILFVVIYRKTI